jgi:thiol-disulfide isomerase/thioredoxin
MAAVLLAAVSSRAEGTLLNIGSPAPAIKVEKWVKGTPVTAFETGKVYVVEFWATWCGPCKVAMPHLSELARKFTNKVTFTGVSVLEQGEDTTKKVEAFVKNMGDNMGYNVCADGSAAFMAANWLAAAGESGIPCTFVIDGGGKVAWIGHPNKLEEVLEKVLAGTADYRELAKTRAAARAGTAIEPSAAREIQMAIDAKEYAETVKAIDRSTNQMVIKKFQAEKLRALMLTDEPKGMAFGKEILEQPMTKSTSALDLIKAGTMLGATEGLSKPAYGLAIDLLTKAAEAKPVEPDPGMMRMSVNVEAVKRFIEMTQKKAATAKE